MEINEMVEFLQLGAKATLADETDPEFDWEPQFVVRTGRDRMGMVLVPPYSNQESKEIVMHLLKTVVERLEGNACAMLTSTWRVSGSPTDPGAASLLRGEILPSEHPSRVEGLLIVACEAGMEGAITSMADIIRDGVGPPTLAEWETNHSSSNKGAMVEPLIEAVNKAESVVKH